MDIAAKLFAEITAAAVIGGAIAGVEVGAPAAVQAQPAAFGIPLNPPPAQQLPSAEQVNAILTDLADPGVPDQVKSGLVQGGISSERRAFTHSRLDKAAAHGQLPVSFAVGNIWRVGPDTAAAQVSVSGPKLLAPVTKVFTFVDQNGWMLSSDSAAALIQTVTET